MNGSIKPALWTRLWERINRTGRGPTGRRQGFGGLAGYRASVLGRAAEPQNPPQESSSSIPKQALYLAKLRRPLPSLVVYYARALPLRSRYSSLPSLPTARRRTRPQQCREAGVGRGRSLRLRTRKLRPSGSLTEAERLQWKQRSSVSKLSRLRRSPRRRRTHHGACYPRADATLGDAPRCRAAVASAPSLCAGASANE